MNASLVKCLFLCPLFFLRCGGRWRVQILVYFTHEGQPQAEMCDIRPCWRYGMRIDSSRGFNNLPFRDGARLLRDEVQGILAGGTDEVIILLLDHTFVVRGNEFNGTFPIPAATETFTAKSAIRPEMNGAK